MRYWMGRHIPTRLPGSHRMRARRDLATGFFVFLFALAPASAQVSVRADIVSGGGGHSESAGGCLRLDATLGEAVAGTASGGAFAVTTGYWARIDSRSRDALFDTGFEECL